jgi:thiosulfate dehydrogenase
MNGRPLPSDSKEMTVILTYYQWISTELLIYTYVLWLELKHIESTHQSNRTKGKEIYGQKCTGCHDSDGPGTQIVLPLWGKDSFNGGAGMATLTDLAAFSHDCMRQGNPGLTDEATLDVAAFVIASQDPILCLREDRIYNEFKYVRNQPFLVLFWLLGLYMI